MFHTKIVGFHQMHQTAILIHLECRYKRILKINLDNAGDIPEFYQLISQKNT